jgi:RNA 2',3'-cyclic 3'-phosphodiesterase
MRTFISIKFPPKILMQIKEIQEKLPAFIGKKTELKNLHLTLKFLGDVNSENIEKIKLRLREIKFGKFESKINEIGFFDKGKDGRGVLWLGITNCEKLQKQIDKSLDGIYEKEKRFMGHLTIARIKEISDTKKFEEELKKIEISNIFFIADKFYLVESKLQKESPEYKIIEEYTLN